MNGKTLGLLLAVISLLGLGMTPDTAPAQEEEERGIYFSKKVYVEEPLPVYADSKDLLPSPILEGNPGWIEMYWKCWELAFSHLRQPQGPFVSNYVDEAYNNSIFQWDTIFMVMFWRYAHAVFPAAQSFDNFYCRQHSDGFICREIFEVARRAGRDRHTKDSPQAINPPLFSWAEVEYYKVSGDKSRFEAVLPVLEKYVQWLEENRIAPQAKHELYWQTGNGSGMDNTPQTGSAWVEMSAQMVRQYDDLAFMAEELGKKDKAEAFRQRGKQIADKINQLMWDEETGFYWNLNDEGEWVPCKTIGFSWTLMAGIPSKRQAERVTKNLMNPALFYRQIPFATLAADHPDFVPTGGYWLGSVWAPTNYQAIKGLERYGFEAEAAEATEKYLAGMYEVFKKTNTVWENYASESHAPGEPAKPDFVGWTGCGPIALLIENVIGLRPDAANNRIAWHLRRTDRHGIERLKIGPATLSLVCEARDSEASPAYVTLLSDEPFTVKIIHPYGQKEVQLQSGAAMQLTIPE